MKVLYVTTVGRTMNFFKDFFKVLVSMGYSIDLACNESGEIPEEIKKTVSTVYNLPFSRTPFSKGNLEAGRKLKKIIAEEHYDIVHCHTPNAAVITRLVCQKVRKSGTKVIYTAHGFHFYKGAPLKNWLLYYPIEKLCSYMTDVLITINKEDYELAGKKMHARKVEYVPGVGVDIEKFGEVHVDVKKIRNELQVPNGMLWVLAVGELSERKNHRNLIKAVMNLENIYLTIAGQGNLKEELEQFINEFKISDRVKLLGFRTDISELCSAADIFAFPSYQEGLPVALMEAMACGKPVVCSNIRGNTDLVEDGQGGFLFNPYKPWEISDAIANLINADRKKMGLENREKIKRFTIQKVIEINKKIYKGMEVSVL